MKIYLCCIACIIFNCSLSFSQSQSVTDSLLNKIEASTDTTKIKLYIEIIRNVNNSDPKRGLNYAEKALKIAKTIDDKSWEVRVLNTFGITYYFLGRYSEAIEYLKKSLTLGRKINYPKISATINNLGGLYLEISDHSTALKYFLEVLDLAQTQGTSYNCAFAYTNIGIVVQGQKEYNRALDYYKRALAIFRENKDNENTTLTLNHLGEIYFLLDDYKIAMGYYSEALEIAKEFNLNRQRIVSLHAIGQLYFKYKQYRKSLFYFFEAKKIIDESNIMNEYAALLNSIGSSYRALKRYDEAISYSKNSAETALTQNTKRNLFDAYNNLSLAYAGKGDFKTAFEFNKSASVVRDSIYAETNNKQLAELRIQYETEKNELTILYQENEIEKQRYLMYNIYLAIIVLVVFSIILYFLLREKQKVNLELNNQKNSLLRDAEIIDDKNNELKRINAIKDNMFAIIGHDLRNPFFSLKGMLSLVETDQISDHECKDFLMDYSTTINATNDLLENLLNWSLQQIGGNKITFIDILLSELVEDSINLINKSAAKKEIEITYNVPQTQMVRGDRNMISLILRNILSNAVKFTHQGGRINLESIINNSKVIVVVSDNGIGMTSEQLNIIFTFDRAKLTVGTKNEKGSGLGLYLCKDYIEKNNGNIWVESIPGKGSTFYFSLDLSSNPVPVPC